MAIHLPQDRVPSQHKATEHKPPSTAHTIHGLRCPMMHHEDRSFHRLGMGRRWQLGGRPAFGVMAYRPHGGQQGKRARGHLRDACRRQHPRKGTIH